MKGPNFKPSASFERQPRLEDITPTLLTLLGIPVGEDMDGRVLLEAFDPDFLEEFPPRKIPSHDRGAKFKPRATISEQDNALMDKLKALGYTQ
jgi:hypothetical protein